MGAGLHPTKLAVAAVLLVALLVAPGAAAARRLRHAGHALQQGPHGCALLVERRHALEVCTNCLSLQPSKPLPLPSDGLSAAAADLAWLADPYSVGITCKDTCTPEQQAAWLANVTAAAQKMGATAVSLVYIPESQAGETCT